MPLISAPHKHLGDAWCSYTALQEPQGDFEPISYLPGGNKDVSLI